MDVNVLEDARRNRMTSPAATAVVHPDRVLLSYVVPAEIDGGTPPVMSPPMAGG
jgi:hypothetical protein